MTARKRKPARNTRRARGRWSNRERPTAPYRTGDAASLRGIPPTGEGTRAHGYITACEAGQQQRFRFRADVAGSPDPAEPSDAPGRAPATGPATVERDAS